MVDERYLLQIYLKVCLLVICNIILLIEIDKQSIRRWWTMPHITEDQRIRYGAYHNLFTYYKLYNYEEFFIFTRTTVSQFSYLLSLVEHKLKKVGNRALSPELKLAAVLQ